MSKNNLKEAAFALGFKKRSIITLFSQTSKTVIYQAPHPGCQDGILYVKFQKFGIFEVVWHGNFCLAYTL